MLHVLQLEGSISFGRDFRERSSGAHGSGWRSGCDIPGGDCGVPPGNPAPPVCCGGVLPGGVLPSCCPPGGGGAPPPEPGHPAAPPPGDELPP